MFKNKVLAATAATAIGLGSFVTVNVAQADNIFDLMNPFEWFDDDYDDWYRYGPPGYGPYAHPWGHPGYQRQRIVILMPEQQGAAAAQQKLPE